MNGCYMICEKSSDDLGPHRELFNMERVRLHCHGFHLQPVACEGLSNMRIR